MDRQTDDKYWQPAYIIDSWQIANLVDMTNNLHTYNLVIWLSHWQMTYWHYESFYNWQLTYWQPGYMTDCWHDNNIVI